MKPAASSLSGVPPKPEPCGDRSAAKPGFSISYMILAAALAKLGRSHETKAAEGVRSSVQLQEQRTMCRSRRHASARHSCPFRKFDPSRFAASGKNHRVIKCNACGLAPPCSSRDAILHLLVKTRNNSMLSSTEGNAHPKLRHPVAMVNESW